MAIKPTDNEAFYREVDEELRREQMANVWERYGKLIIGGVLALILAIGGYIWWEQRQVAKAGEQSEQLSAAMQDMAGGNSAAGTAKLDALAKDGSPGIRAAALFAKANIALGKNDQSGATAGFKGIAEDSSLPKPYRDLALVRQTALEFDKLQPQQVVERLSPLAGEGSPYRAAAGELVALAHVKGNNLKAAGEMFAAIAKDKNMPQSARSRALQAAGTLGVDALPPESEIKDDGLAPTAPPPAAAPAAAASAATPAPAKEAK